MIEVRSKLTGKNDGGEVNVIVRHMIERAGIEFVLITACLILSLRVIAHSIPSPYFSLVEDLSIDMLESPILEGKMRHWISMVCDSSFESTHSI